MKTYLFYIYFVILNIISCSAQACFDHKDWTDGDSIEDARITTHSLHESTTHVDEWLRKFDHPCYQVREQIIEDLKWFGMEDGALDRARFNVPLLCFGTGKNKYNLCTASVRPTFVEEGDETVDIKNRLEPDHNFNAFSDLALHSLCMRQKSYSAIYFGHVANYFPPDAFLFQCYAKLLKSGGVFLYKSFAFLDSVVIPKILGKSTMEEVEDLYKTVMSQNGFCNIRVIERDETEGLKDGVGDVVGRSYIIYAEKDDTFTKELVAPQESMQFDLSESISAWLSRESEVSVKGPDACELGADNKDNHSTTSSTVSCLSGESTPDLSLGGDSEAESQDGLDKTIEIFLEDECEFKFYEDSVSNDDDEAAKAQLSAAEKDNSGSLSPD